MVGKVMLKGIAMPIVNGLVNIYVTHLTGIYSS